MKMATPAGTLVFRKRLTATDVNHRLSLPTRALQSLPPFEPDSNRIIFPVYDEQTGIRFDFECRRRKTGPYLKPVVSRGWPEFVRAKGVVAGDDVRLSMAAGKSGAGVRYTITVFRRRLRLFGITIDV